MIDDRLIVRGAEGYDEARFARVFNARRPERYPAAVLVAESEDDVVEGIRLARDRGWKVALRAGGHSFPAWSLRDDALVIDLGGFKEIALDESTGVVRATPAVSSGALNSYLSDYGLFFGSAGCPSPGIGGFLLQGGLGWGFRGWGHAAEQIVAIDVVTADGELVRADEQRNSDLFWAARGAGPATAERSRDSTSRPARTQAGWPQRRRSIRSRGTPRTVHHATSSRRPTSS